jgi:hypothetical protein
LLRCDMNFQCHSLKKFLRSTAFAKILRSNWIIIGHHLWPNMSQWEFVPGFGDETMFPCGLWGSHSGKRRQNWTVNVFYDKDKGSRDCMRLRLDKR